LNSQKTAKGPPSDSMAPLLFICPKTNQQAPTGNYCGEVHEISVRETYIDGVLSDVVDGLRQAV
jgi:hypothetical protein